ncbi:MAG: imidazoleglycerol-phosphate dehydratase HisB [Lachnospiraceae bacterium]|nr:imidazoleglycerol-phosphate dehydratase HisB [Lachnospiraceae bacterium]
MDRIASVTRKTKETDIICTINIDGTGKSDISTGIGFFDHMLCGFAKHGLFDITIKTVGDLNVDGHHTVEDTGIVLGQAFKEAINDKAGIRRFGDCILPMDESLVLSAVDLSGRHFLSFDLELDSPMIGDFDSQLVHEFFYAFSDAARMNLHIKKINGVNSHHIVEAAFKSVAKSLDMATSFDERIKGVQSTKGVL